jgi:predicted kinase
MQLVVFCGVQGAGKTSFYRFGFFETHVRVNLDMLRSRERERILVEACIAARQRFVVDNTNPTVESRRLYIEPAKAAGFEVVGYTFPSTPRDALAVNARRPLHQQLTTKAVLETLERIEPPTMEEGFDALYAVRMDGEGGFAVDPL